MALRSVAAAVVAAVAVLLVVAGPAVVDTVETHRLESMATRLATAQQAAVSGAVSRHFVEADC